MALKYGKFEAMLTEVDAFTGSCDVIIQPPIHLSEYGAQELEHFRSGVEDEDDRLGIPTTVREKAWTDDGSFYNLQSDAISGGDYSPEDGIRHFRAVAHEIMKYGDILDKIPHGSRQG